MISPRSVLVAVLCCASFALGWYVHAPATPSYQPATNAIVASAKQDTIVVEKVVTNTKWKVRYDSIRDTLNITDTVQVKEYVRVADSSLYACNQALHGCLTALSLKDTVIRQQIRYIDNRARLPSYMRELASVGIGIIIGRQLRLR